MNKKTIKWAAGVFSAISLAMCTSYGEAAAESAGTTVKALSSATTKVTFGGFIKGGYRYMSLRDYAINYGASNPALKPKNFNNFYMPSVRLLLDGETSEGWSGSIGIECSPSSGDKALSVDDNNGGTFTDSILLDKAYIQKVFNEYIRVRAGYQKVNWVMEQTTSDVELKPLSRSLATGFFTTLGRNAIAYSDTTSSTTASVTLRGTQFGGRHAGIFASGEYNSFNYSLALVNGKPGTGGYSTGGTSHMGVFAGLGYDFVVKEADISVGLNAGYKSHGATNGNATTGSFPKQAVWGLNPYVKATFHKFTLMAEFMYGSVKNGRVTAANETAKPWGFNIMPSYMLNDNWELVARYSMLNTNRMGTNTTNAYGQIPTAQVHLDELLFNKGQSLYFGVNHYMLGGALKATLGYEYMLFKERGLGSVTATKQVVFNGAKVRTHGVGASLQLLF